MHGTCMQKTRTFVLRTWDIFFASQLLPETWGFLDGDGHLTALFMAGWCSVLCIDSLISVVWQARRTLQILNLVAPVTQCLRDVMSHWNFSFSFPFLVGKITGRPYIKVSHVKERPRVDNSLSRSERNDGKFQTESPAKIHVCLFFPQDF